ncbi:uncharacterized protein LOC144423027 [Styela clava]
MSDRLEDVIRGCVRQFASTVDFTTFAQSGNGLSLSVQDVTTIIENHRFSVEEQKKKLFWLWVNRNQPNVTAQRIRNLVTQYYALEQQGAAAPIERLEDVFQDVAKRFSSKEFKQFAQFARSGQGLSLGAHEIDEVMEDYKYTRERKLKLLWKWRHSKYPNTNNAAVIERIRAVVGLYVQDANQVEEEQIIQEDGDRMLESFKKLSVKPTQTTEVSEEKEFLEVVKNYTKQMLESRLKSASEKTKMDDFILPRVTEFKESESNKQSSLQSVDIKKIHFDNSVNRVMLLGDTGSGKTTFSMKYALSALENKLNFSNEIKMVYFVDVTNLQGDSQSTAFDLLFVQQLGSKLPKHLHKVGQEWFEQNSKHILFVVDGLDQTQKSFANEYRRIGVDTLAETNTILANILSGHMYPGMKILSTTRWNVYWKLPPDLKATLNLTLGGWDDETLKLLVEKLFSPEARKIFDDLRRKAPGFVSNPMFFFYLVRVLKDFQEIDVDTLTNLMVSVLKLFSGSHHGLNVGSLLLELMKLAYHGMIENRFVFTASYIRSLKLNMNDMRGLVEMDADTRFVEYIAGDDDISLRFPHQSIGEILAALYACTLDSDEYKKFIENYYNKPGMEVVIKHTFGIILNKSTSEKAAKYLPDNLHIKSEYLMGFLDKLLKGRVISDKRVVTLLHECGPDVIKKVCSQIKEMDLTSVQPSDQHAVMSVAEHSPSLHTLKLFNLEIHPENYSSLQHLLGSVQNIHVYCFNLINCDSENLRILDEVAMKGNLKIGWILEISESPALEPPGYYYVIGLVYHGGAESFLMSDCGLNAEKISKMNQAVIEYGVKLNSLYIVKDPNMDAEAFQQLPQILGNAKTEDLKLNDCGLNAEKLSKMNQAVIEYGVKLNSLDIIKDPNMDAEAFQQLPQLLGNARTNNLRLTDCGLNAEKINKMNQAVIEYGVKLYTLSIYGNPNMDAEAFQQLAKFLKNTEGKNLQAHHCTPTSEQLSALCSSLENEDVELSNLYLRRSTTESLTDDELMIVSRLVQKVEKLNFSCQKLSKSKMEFLRKETLRLCPIAKINSGSWGFRISNPIVAQAQ